MSMSRNGIWCWFVLGLIAFAPVTSPLRAQPPTPRQGYELISEDTRRVNGGSVTVYIEVAQNTLPQSCSDTCRDPFRSFNAPCCVYDRTAALWIQNDSNRWLQINEVRFRDIWQRSSRCNRPFYVAPHSKERMAQHTRQIYHYRNNPVSSISRGYRAETFNWLAIDGTPRDRSGRKSC